jgi:hypothetical protein
MAGEPSARSTLRHGSPAVSSSNLTRRTSPPVDEPVTSSRTYGDAVPDGLLDASL